MSDEASLSGRSASSANHIRPVPAASGIGAAIHARSRPNPLPRLETLSQGVSSKPTCGSSVSVTPHRR
jgi:hypothetical protein